MSKIKVTNKTLINQYRQLVDMEQTGDVMFFFNAAKIRQWKSDNMIRVNSILDRMGEIDKDFYKHAAIDGKIEWEMAEDANKKQAPVLKEGKTSEDFNKAYDELLKEETTIEC